MFSSQPPSSYNLNEANALGDDNVRQQLQHPAQRPPSGAAHHQNRHPHSHLSSLEHDGAVNNFPTNIFHHQPPTTSTTIMPNQHQAHHRPLAHPNQQTAHSNNNGNSPQQQHFHQSQLNQMACLQATHFDQAQQQQQVQPQHITCMSAMNSDNLTNQLANAGHVIFNQNGLIRLGQHAGILNTSTSQAAIVVNTITNELRQQQQQSQHQAIPTFAICDSNAGGNVISAYSTNCHNITNNPTSSSLSPRQTTTSSSSGGGGKSYNSSEIFSNRTPNSQSANSSQGGKSGGGRKKSRKSELSRTSQSDDGETTVRRTFACPTCDKDFTEKFNMKRHMQVHSPARPKYICNECSKSFAWKDNFIRHKKAAHNNQARAIQTFPGHQ